eukprot:TRINITY_DN11242_c0_g1_i2.p2 TRINITY_DN11242_c0_g1~~TRINITY_DN11242_c0_g1_i2.p2  ORF type:complete len:181 (-),score=22.93 TRINITY_DN11242_c0_g1_i2:208-750(-)
MGNVLLKLFRCHFPRWGAPVRAAEQPSQDVVPMLPVAAAPIGQGAGGDLSLICGLPDDLALQCLARVPRAHHAVLRCVCSAWRRVADSEELYRLRRAARVSEEWFYVLTLFPLLKAFDPVAVKWHILPPMPGVQDSDLLIDCACVVVGHRVSGTSFPPCQAYVTATAHRLSLHWSRPSGK